MCPCGGYYTLMRESKDPKHLRLRMVQTARRHGVKPTARLFACSPNTVRKWLARYDGTLASLADRSRAPIHRPRKLSPEAEKQILRAKKRLPTWGAKRLKRDMNLPYSHKAISRVLKEHGLNRKWRRKKHQTKRCLREIKRNWDLWQQISMDTKVLSDLPEYWLQARAKGLPLYQYTARDVSTGALFLAFADELSLTYAQLFAERILQHLQSYGTDMSAITVQTDNGSEFVGSWQAVEDSAFVRTVKRYGCTHRAIPPGAHRFQADVETVHALMETEFYLEPFNNRRNFIAKAATYQHFFNYVRANSGKEHKCPWQLVREKNPNNPIDLLYLTPVFLQDLLRTRLPRTPRGHHVRGHPWSVRGVCLDRRGGCW